MRGSMSDVQDLFVAGAVTSGMLHCHPGTLLRRVVPGRPLAAASACLIEHTHKAGHDLSIKATSALLLMC
jgi:hypothetical protein